MTTGYPPELVEAISRIRPTPERLDDEIRRDTDPFYVELSLRYALFSYVAPEELRGRRLLDFGCGAGSSTVVLARLAPGVEIVGVDLEEENLEVARLRAAHYDLRGEFHRSPGPNRLPDVGEFDFVLLSAVFEHLLPAERGPLLQQLWERLRPGGVLFINQLPHRWYPVETHTSGLPLLNYVPDRVAGWAAARWSRRGLRGATWEEMLRWGIRGGTAREVMRLLPRDASLMRPSRLGSRDQADLWFGVSMTARPWWVKRPMRWVFKAVLVVPSLSLAVRKRALADG